MGDGRWEMGRGCLFFDLLPSSFQLPGAAIQGGVVLPRDFWCSWPPENAKNAKERACAAHAAGSQGLPRPRVPCVLRRRMWLDR
jgi:hypothetical protein